MGYAKYFEDNQRFNDERFFMLDRHNLYRRTDIDPPAFGCPYCTAFFDDKEELSNHIKGCHGSVSKLLLLNQQVVQEAALVREITSVVVVQHDLSEPILINGESTSCVEQGGDITAQVQQVGKVSTNIDIQVGDKVWKISVQPYEEINLVKLEDIRCKWDQKTKDHQPIDLDKTIEVNDFEKRCLHGFFNYYIACNAEPALKKHRYEDANNMLSEFVQIVPAAKVILKLIAFKFNWPHRLSELCGNGDIFTNICEFFFELSSKENPPFDGDKAIYIEDELEESLRGILNFQSKKFDGVEEYLRKFGQEDLMNMQDSNARDRIYLLKARYAKQNGKAHDARRYYDEIKTPFFEAERERFIKNMRQE